MVLSIEKDSDARETLKLRSFFRQFRGGAPNVYYDFLQGKIDLAELYRRYPQEAEKADQEAWLAELGKHPTSEIDDRIAQVLEGHDKWVLIGGPPCQAYSVVGRARMARQRKKYEKDPRHFLYREYLRTLAVHRPPVFVMENVKGILSTKVEGSLIIDRILDDLRNPCEAIRGLRTSRTKKAARYTLYAFADYERNGSPPANSENDPTGYVIRCELHGIPQARHRFIVLGVRNDLDSSLSPLPVFTRAISMWKAIADLPKLRSRLSNSDDSPKEWVKTIRMILDRKIIDDAAVDVKVRGLLRKMVRNLADGLSTGGEFVRATKKPSWQRGWFFDPHMRGVCNHSARSHMPSDLLRYFFAASFAKVHGRSPLLTEFPEALLPDHENVKNADDGRGVFLDRFRVQLKNRPSTTITSHMNRDGHYYIHPDPLQCRSLTVREAARLQTFPDNYMFLGSRTSQYEQVGNAVPPLLARKLAGIVYRFLK